MNKLLRKGVIAPLSLSILFSNTAFLTTFADSQVLDNQVLGNSTYQEISYDAQNTVDDNHISIVPEAKNICILPKDPKYFYAITDIWHDAFDSVYGSELVSGKFMNYYVNNMFTKYDTYVYMHEGKAVSMMMLIPTSLTLKNGEVKDGYYVYAVGTKNEYQNNGITTLMLNFIDEYSKSQGKVFRILNPDRTHDWLYNFYGKRGYECVNVRRVYMTPEEVLEVAQDAEPMVYQDGLPADNLYNCRKVNLGNDTGFVQWSENELQVVQGEYKLPHNNYHELYFGDWQYAIIRYGRNLHDTQNIIVKEFYIKDENKKAFFKTLSQLFEGKNIIFDMPDSDERSNFFEGKPYRVLPLSMINLRNSEDIKSQVKLPIYFYFGMD